MLPLGHHIRLKADLLYCVLCFLKQTAERHPPLLLCQCLLNLAIASHLRLRLNVSESLLSNLACACSYLCVPHTACVNVKSSVIDAAGGAGCVCAAAVRSSLLRFVIVTASCAPLLIGKQSAL